MLADVTKLVGQHPEILQEEKRASANPPKTERDAVRSKATGQFLSPEKTVLTPETIPHELAIRTPGTKGTNSHRSQKWEEAKQAAKEKEEGRRASQQKNSSRQHCGPNSSYSLNRSNSNERCTSFRECKQRAVRRG